jgi:hypothetical protein
MDNRIFNVNGEGDEMLLLTLKLAFDQAGHNTMVTSWSVDKEKGLILHHYSSKGTPFPMPLKAEELFPLIKAWLGDAEAKTIECEGWDSDMSHDGHNSFGWRVYCEDWGHVNSDHGAFLAIKPAYMWHGK